MPICNLRFKHVNKYIYALRLQEINFFQFGVKKGEYIISGTL